MTNSISSAEVTGSDGIIWRDAPWWKFEPEAHHDVTMATGNGIRLTLAKPFARPGERWNEVMVDVHPTSVSIEKTCLRVRLFEHGTIDIVEEVSLRPQSSSGGLLVDLRRHSLTAARLSVELFEGTKRTGAAEVCLQALDPQTKLEPGKKIAINIDVPPNIDTVESWPITFGIPFPAGALWDLNNLRLVNSEGEQIPHQKEVTGLWGPDGAIKWVRFDALVSSAGNFGRGVWGDERGVCLSAQSPLPNPPPKYGCFVEVAAPNESKPRKSVHVVAEYGKVVIDTGEARYVLSEDLSPIESVWLGDNLVATSAQTRGLYVIDQNGQLASASADNATMKVEADGPVAACVRCEGFYRTAEGKQLARHITRFVFIANTELR